MDALFEEQDFTEKYDQYMPKTLQFVADHIVRYVREKRTVGSTGLLRLAVDLGCGTGQNTTVFADHFDRVLATDASNLMIRKAIELHRHTAPANVEFAVSPAEDLSIAGVEDGSVDLLTGAFCIHWFDLPKFFVEARRVLAPNGVLAVISQKFDPYHPTDPSKTEELLRIKSDFYKAMPRNKSEDPRVLMYRSNYVDVVFPVDDFFRGIVGTTVSQMSVSRLRFCHRNVLVCKQFCDELPEEAAVILQTYQDKLMDVVAENGRHGDPNTTMVHIKHHHQLVLGRMNGSLID